MTSEFEISTNLLSISFSDEGCPSIGQPRKHVVCYYDGKRPVSSLNICLCTHLIYTSIGINEYGQLHLSESKYKFSSKVFSTISRLYLINL